MKKLVTVLCCSVILFSQPVFAANESCDAKASKQRLSGMARFNFVKRCEATLESARKICESRAAEKRLMGEAKDNFIKKCTIDESN